jgi:CRP/FNR family transcriptional regulator, dissimilatory nitrate respiration regulator
MMRAWRKAGGCDMIGIMSEPVVVLLSALATRTLLLRPREVLFRVDDTVRALFIVESGVVQLIRPLPHGGEVTLQRATAGKLLAEASIFSRRYHCDAVAVEDSELRSVPMRAIHEELRTNQDLNSAVMGHLAHELQRARSHAEILALKTVKDRIAAWQTFHGREIPPKGQWRTLATEIGVSSEALYRELASKRMKGR